MDQEYYFIALYAVLFSVFTSVYYIRLVRFILFIEYDKYPKVFLVPVCYRQCLFISFITLLNVFFFFFQGPLLIFLNTKFLLYLKLLILC